MLHLEMVVTARKPRNAVEKAAKDKGQQGQQATLPVLYIEMLYIYIYNMYTYTPSI